MASIIKKLAKELTAEYGKGYTKTNLYHFYSFYKTYPEIFHSASGKLLLSWTHYRTLLQVNDKDARDWYEKEALEQTWSVVTLQRNISSQYYYRMLQTQRQDLVENEMKELTASYQNDKYEFIKSPVIAEFSGFAQNTDFTESDLEKSILSNLQKFLMEFDIYAHTNNGPFEFQLSGNEKSVPGDEVLQISKMFPRQKIEYRLNSPYIPDTARVFTGSIATQNRGKEYENNISCTSPDDRISGPLVKKEVHYIPPFGQTKSIGTYLLVIPANEKGALERVIINALGDIPEEAEITQEVIRFIDNLKENFLEELKQTNKANKATVVTFFSVRYPQNAMRSFGR